VSTQRGSVRLPVAAADLPPGVVWVPGNSGPATVRRSLGVGHGAVVTVRAGNGPASSTAASSTAASKTATSKTGWGGKS
ncbi:MAG: hypothetical protein LC644_09710, partial [Pseudonocardia sp.]|nr:hypothetical protein [Pseudonocardia sp.]